MAWQRGDDDGRYRMNTKAMLCRSLIDICLGTCCILVRSKSEHGMWKTIGKPKEAMKKRHKMCWFGFFEQKNKNRNNQPQIHVGKPFAVAAACWKWASVAIVASKKDRRLSLAFVRVGGRTWLKMSSSPMGKFGSSGEHFHFLSVALARTRNCEKQEQILGNSIFCKMELWPHAMHQWIDLKELHRRWKLRVPNSEY